MAQLVKSWWKGCGRRCCWESRPQEVGCIQQGRCFKVLLYIDGHCPVFALSVLTIVPSYCTGQPPHFCDDPLRPEEPRCAARDRLRFLLRDLTSNNTTRHDSTATLFNGTDSTIRHDADTFNGPSTSLLSGVRTVHHILDRQSMSFSSTISSAKVSLLFNTTDTGTQKGRAKERFSNKSVLLT
jgi:hypothetical protein